MSKKRPRTESSYVEDHIGLNLAGVAPKSAVQQFFDRYTGRRADNTAFYFMNKRNQQGVIATLITPALGDRHFSGQQCSDKKTAEQSAATVFVEDVEVLEIAACLPPPLATIRRIADGYHSRKQKLVAKGLSPKEAVEQLVLEIYETLRGKGCRSQMFDN